MIYFDNAATTHPKPEPVYDLTARAMREFCGNPGRSSHRMSMLADREVFACRNAAAEFFGAQPERVIFTYNTTYALNIAIKCAYISGSILISDLEHNSVRRPCDALTDNLRVFDSALEISDEKQRTEAILASIRSQLRHTASNNVLLVCTAASNICGASMPIAEIGRFCRESGIYFIVDGAQAAGTRELNVERDCIDALCLPGHKGLYGPMGTGMLILGDSLPAKTFIEGGSGVNSLDVAMPELPPERYEGGTLAVQNIAGLRAGIEFVRSRGVNAIFEHEKRLAALMQARLKQRFSNRLKLYGDKQDGGILLFNIAGYSSTDIAEFLDRHDICVRSGFHCAPLAHRRLKTGASGAVRVSFGIFNTEDEVDCACEALSKLK